MAEAKQRADWLKVGIATAWIINKNGWTKQPVNPLTIIPEQFRPPPEPVPEKSEEQLAEENRLAWGVLDRVFGGK
jgi:hypothetical protein